MSLSVAAVLLAQRRLETRAQLLRVQVLLVGRHDELPRAARVRLEIATIGQLPRRTAQIERLHDAAQSGAAAASAARLRARLAPRRSPAAPLAAELAAGSPAPRAARLRASAGGATARGTGRRSRRGPSSAAGRNANIRSSVISKPMRGSRHNGRSLRPCSAI